MVIISTKFGEKMKKRRKKLGKTHESLATDINVSRKSVEHWENSTVSADSIKAINIVNLCDVLQCDFEYLFGNQPFPRKEETDIIAATGLDPKAVEQLCLAHSERYWFVIQALNELLKYDNLRLLDLIGQYVMMDEHETVELHDGERIDKGVLYSRKIEQELLKLRCQVQKNNKKVQTLNTGRDNPDAYIWARGNE